MSMIEVMMASRDYCMKIGRVSNPVDKCIFINCLGRLINTA